jgi:small subunit ribosomal protein S1
MASTAKKIAPKIVENVSVKDVTGENFSFENLLNESLKDIKSFEGSVVEGTVVGIDDEFVTIDVGLKSEGRVPLREFGAAGTKSEIKVGDKVEVYVERMENRTGEAGLSREKARREESWIVLEKLHKANERVTGTIFGSRQGWFHR